MTSEHRYPFSSILSITFILSLSSSLSLPLSFILCLSVHLEVFYVTGYSQAAASTKPCLKDNTLFLFFFLSLFLTYFTQFIPLSQSFLYKRGILSVAAPPVSPLVLSRDLNEIPSIKSVCSEYYYLSHAHILKACFHFLIEKLIKKVLPFVPMSKKNCRLATESQSENLNSLL